MNKYIFIGAFLLLAYSGSSAADVKDVVSETTKEVVSFTKDFFKGVKDGVDSGRTSTESVDGALVVTNVELLNSLLEIEIIKVSTSSEGRFTEVEVGFKNPNEKAIRVANLYDSGVTILIDADGYSNPVERQASSESEVTVPPSAGVKHKFRFISPASKASKLRIWSREFDLTDSVTLPDPAPGTKA